MNIKILASFLLFFLFSFQFNSFSQQSQPVTITVRDSSDYTPLKDVVIKIDAKRANLSSNDEGIHTFFLPPGEYALTVSHFGYRSFRERLIIKKSEVKLLVSLINVAKELDEITVNSQVINGNVARPLLGVSALSIKAIKKIPAMMGETDVLRGLQMLPGVTSVGEAANGVNIRGGTTDQNLILLDDTPIFNPTHLFGLFSIFPPDAVSGLELYKGGIPAKFGGRASSVIDISLINPSLEKFKMTGGISLVSNRLTIETPIVKEKLSIMVSGRASFNDFIFKLGPPKLQNIKANFYDLATKLF